MLCKLRWLLSLALLLEQGLVALASAASLPNLVFILLDAGRADRFGLWGGPNQPTPTLDALARSGVAFRRHFANAHATRASMPQLMTGRYYGQSILRPFLPDAHPRELSFARPDPSATLLPALLQDSGYRAVGVSSHPWVVAESDFGRRFDRLEFVAGEPSHGHADGAGVIDRALAFWRERDSTKPTFLYVHLMDVHTPRFLPEPEPRYPVPGFDWRQRFDPGGEPKFLRDARRWAMNDAHGFTDLDKRHFAAVYDTRLNYADQLVARLLATLRDGDPDLRRTVVLLVADHGEELGDDGRTDHLDSLVDAVQHIPWILAGGPVRPGQLVDRFTEQIDVLPTVLATLGIALPAGARVDGRAQLASDGAVCAGCTKSAVFYAYEDYQAIRTNRYRLRIRDRGSIGARCAGQKELVRLGRREVRLDVDGRHRSVAARLERRIARRLGPPLRTYLAQRFGAPTASFLVRPEFWSLGADARLACVPLSADAVASALRVPGWLWSGRGVTVLRSEGDRPLPVALAVPDGDYQVDAAVVPIEPMPWFFGMRRWRQRSFLPEEPRAFVPLGTAHAGGGALTVAIPAAAGTGNHIVGLRLSPPSAVPAAPGAPEDPQLRERLRALGYVQ